MDSFVEPIRTTTSLMAIATAFYAWKLLDRGDRSRAIGVAAIWLVVVTAFSLVVSHGLRVIPAPMLVPALMGVGTLIGVAAVLSPEGSARLAALDDRSWRVLMATRAVFGSLILAAGAAGLFPAAFALHAGIGDIVVGALALLVPGSLAAGGSRLARFVVFGVGLADFFNVLRLQFVVLLPWLATTTSFGISLLLPWVVVPLLLTVNIAGARLLLAERTRIAPAT